MHQVGNLYVVNGTVGVTCISISSLVGRRVSIKHSVTYVYIQPSSWRWTLGFETCRKHQNNKNENINLETVHFVRLYIIVYKYLTFYHFYSKQSISILWVPLEMPSDAHWDVYLKCTSCTPVNKMIKYRWPTSKLASVKCHEHRLAVLGCCCREANSGTPTSWVLLRELISGTFLSDSLCHFMS